MFTTLVVGIMFFGSASFWSWVIGGTLQVFAVGLAVAELVSAYPLAGGVYQIPLCAPNLPPGELAVRLVDRHRPHGFRGGRLLEHGAVRRRVVRDR
jgi:hypothetical protein